MMVYIAGANRAVDTADTYFREIGKSDVAGNTNAHRRIAERVAISRLGVYDGPPLEARAEYARWIVDCPNCRNAEFAFEDGLFMCTSCFNSDVGGKARRVKTPRERLEIEAELGKRKIINRHWNVGETVDKLIAENPPLAEEA